jgi:two-component system sensor histidine kinase VanS
LSYAAFLVFAGVVVLAGVYVVLRFGPNPPVTDGRPRPEGLLASNQEMALLRVSVVILVSLAAIGLAGGWIIAGWVLRPLQRISAAAEIAATGRLDHRIRLSGRNDEFRQLADTFDYMLDRLHDAFATQERFAANASHELRTPLAVAVTMIEVARADPEAQDYAVLLDRLAITNRRAIDLTEALLRLADINAVTAASERVDLSEIARAALDDHAGDAERRSVTFGARLDAAPTVGDPALLGQLASNLVQNAIRHNHAVGCAEVVTEHDRARGIVTLRVENTGPRYTAEEAGRLVEPFLRGGGRTSRGSEERGYGLGLPLVDRIAAVHGGALVVEPRTAGGLIVTVTFSDHLGRARAASRSGVAGRLTPTLPRKGGGGRTGWGEVGQPR